MDALGQRLLFSVVNTQEAPLAFDGNLWHGTESFTGNRWVITAYTCKHLASFKQEDISALLNWGSLCQVSMLHLRHGRNLRHRSPLRRFHLSFAW